ncbi:MAG: glutamate racemase [Trichococcus flocculiformis]|uniref:Glutamate racemase n=1 Tax=Trichococcus flocculiformis TaxID=82803 RepID=A0A847D822_9LACT|nr:glutamate racemase [Trichococcus flocculiformis]NLD32574.1 glutamate racemase [Trichococcus flocculiformis]
MSKKAIGFIDSGVGGLTVVKQAMKQLPNESIYYLGDSARCPYGPRPKEEVIQYTWEMTQFLLKKDIKMLVIACNTATAAALDVIRERIDIPVIGVINPGSRAAIKHSKNERIAVIGTKGTINSDVYKQTIKDKDKGISVISMSCPKFVPLVESNQYNGSIAKKVVAETLKPLLKESVDTLILGCTHYPLLTPLIQNVMGPCVTLIDSGAETVSEVSTLLDYFRLAESSHNKQASEYRFYTTGSPKLFSDIAENWLGQSIFTIEKVDLLNLIEND